MRRGLLAAAVALLFFVAAPGGGLARNLEEGRVRAGPAPSEERRRLAGPGSAPPTCRSRCGRCAPCRAVHLSVQPGASQPLEYYPEAWRCKCGTKLFMP
ncbi:EPIDERMAL PATTERNING FACTOR-like protein 5 [Wolffia australiana]